MRFGQRIHQGFEPLEAGLELQRQVLGMVPELIQVPTVEPEVFLPGRQRPEEIGFKAQRIMDQYH